jgi:hypothetical protein
MDNLLILLKNPGLAYRKSTDVTNQHRLVISMVDNLELNGKLLIVHWKKYFDLVARRPKIQIGGKI